MPELIVDTRDYFDEVSKERVYWARITVKDTNNPRTFEITRFNEKTGKEEMATEEDPIRRSVEIQMVSKKAFDAEVVLISAELKALAARGYEDSVPTTVDPVSGDTIGSTSSSTTESF